MIGANSALKPQLQTIQDDVTNTTNGQFAAAGRDMSPANYQAVARGVAQGEAPVIANQYNSRCRSHDQLRPVRSTGRAIRPRVC